MIGKRFGRLVVLDWAGRTASRKVLVRVRCDCGEERIVQAANLRSRTGTRSCGCLHREAVAAMGRRNLRPDPSYNAAHKWLRANYAKDRCEECGAEGDLDFAYTGPPGGYSRNRDDYRVLCRAHHVLYDQGRGKVPC